MIEPNHSDLAIAIQCELVGMGRSTYYYQPCGENDFNLNLMRMMDEQHLKTPWYGQRQHVRHLRRQGYDIGRTRVRRLMRLMGLRSLAPQPFTSKPAPGNQIYPYLLRDLQVTRANQVWCADVTYIPMARGFLYLVAVMDWHTRKVFTWRLSNTLDSLFCVEALQDALVQYGKPEIFNTDQGCQFTSAGFTDVLKAADIDISMDGKGCWVDNVFIERLWRSLKYEHVYLYAHETMAQARRGIDQWMRYYNAERPHSSLGDATTPDEIYAQAA
jgi:putative transposase